MHQYLDDLRQYETRLMSQKHLNFIRSLPCLICGNNIETEACHVRYADSRIAKSESGLGRKPSDCFTVPLCSKHHREQHKGNEVRFWLPYEIDPVLISLALFACSGDFEQGSKIVAQ